MFRPNVAFIRFSSESMVVVLYRIGMGMSRWWDLSICDVCYMLFIGGKGGVICDVCYPGMCSSSMSVGCCPMWVSSYCLSISDVYCWWAFVMGCVCSLSFVSVCALYPLYLCVLSILCICACSLAPLHTTHNKSPPTVDIGYGQTVAGDPQRTAASRHTWAAPPG